MGGAPIVIVYFIHKYIPESPRWLLNKNRYEEAMTLLERLEKNLGIEHDSRYIDQNLLNSLKHAQKTATIRVSWMQIFRPPYLTRTIAAYSMYSAALVFWYIGMVYAPAILTEKGFQMSNSILMTGLMMAIGGIAGIIGGYMIDRFGRKPMYIIWALLSAGCSILLTFVDSLGAWLLVGLTLAFFGNAIFSICKLYIAEQYPIELRSTGAGLGEAVSRVTGGVLAPYFVSFLLMAGNQAAVFWFLAICYFISILFLILWGQETKGKSIEAAGDAVRQQDN